jgi:pimeloyl-ACP methyl ester carboxylesterase
MLFRIVFFMVVGGLLNFGVAQQVVLKTSRVYFKKFQSTPVRIEFLEPKTSNDEVILFLPGWNYSATDWKYKTSIVDSALKMGFSVLFVDMGKSVYMDSVYPQARSDYKNYPTRNWLWSAILAEYNSRGWFVDNPTTLKPKTHVFGLSTGARGAALLFLDHPFAFENVVLLSGDFDPLLDKKDALLTNSMGAYNLYPSRWERGNNNIQFRFLQLCKRRNLDSMDGLRLISASIDSLNTNPHVVNLFVSHGLKDPIVPPEHSIQLFERMGENCSVSSNANFSDYNRSTPKILRNSFYINTQQSILITGWFDINGLHDYAFWERASLKAWTELFHVN